MGFKEVRKRDGTLDPSLFLHKINGPGLVYEIVIGLYTGLICSVNGPYQPGLWPDLKIAKFRGLCDFLLENGEMSVVDGTYAHKLFCASTW